MVYPFLAICVCGLYVSAFHEAVKADILPSNVGAVQSEWIAVSYHACGIDLISLGNRLSKPILSNVLGAGTKILEF